MLAKQVRELVGARVELSIGERRDTVGDGDGVRLARDLGFDGTVDERRDVGDARRVVPRGEQLVLLFRAQQRQVSEGLARVRDGGLEQA